jgi:purine nucleoside permease
LESDNHIKHVAPVGLDHVFIKQVESRGLPVQLKGDGAAGGEQWEGGEAGSWRRWWVKDWTNARHLISRGARKKPG